jgi:release factor glutamine methyltransferase
MDARTALLQGTGLLEEAGIAVPRLTAEVLLAHALRRDRVYLFAHPEHELSQIEWLHYGRYLHERLKGKPTQYITRRQEFYGREFRVTPDVLIPRPETEHVVEVALELARLAGETACPTRILDIGTGSGALAVTLQLEAGAAVYATEISFAAARVATENARRLGGRVDIVVGDLMSAIAPGSMDLIVSNPPYVPLGQRAGLQREVRDYEPHTALFAGETGFEIYDRIVAGAPRVLRPGGWLVMELGFCSLDHVAAQLAGWAEVRIEPDLAGIPRVIAARLVGRHGSDTAV